MRYQPPTVPPPSRWRRLFYVIFIAYGLLVGAALLYLPIGFSLVVLVLSMAGFSYVMSGDAER